MSFLVRKKVKEFVRDSSKSKMRFSDNFLEGLEKHVETKITQAMDRAKNNKRSTVRAIDV